MPDMADRAIQIRGSMNQTEKTDIKSLDLKELTAFVESLGEKAFRAKQIYQWLHGKQVTSFDEMSNISKTFIEKLKENSYLVNLKQEDISIGDNCFLGQNSTIMYGCTLANNIIVASGSVVCNSFGEENIIIGGNPARKIGTWDELKCKGNQSMKRKEALSAAKSKEDWKFIKRKEK